MAQRSGSRSPAPSGSAEGCEAPGFEESLARLDEIVARLEQGEIELETALAAFEEGVALVRRCAERLDAAQRRIEVLVREGAGFATRAFEPPAGEED
jgi:exodeoxyribonuclease VII small subunit